MTEREINKTIHEARGLCWHEATFQMSNCIKCGVNIDFQKPLNPSYSTDWRAYGEAIEFLRDRGLWIEFVRWGHEKHFTQCWTDLLNPLRGSTALAEFTEANPELFGRGEV